MAAWSVITTSYGCWEIHTDSWLKFTPTIPPQKKTCWNQYLKSNKSPVFGLFLNGWSVDFSHGGMCSLEWKGYLEIKKSSLFTTDHTDPGCVFQQTPHRCNETYIYIHIHSIYILYIYIHSRLYMWYIYIHTLRCAPNLKTYGLPAWGSCVAPLILRPMPCPIAPAQRSTAGLDLRPRLASWSRFTPGSSNREESGDHDESYTKPFAVFKGIPSKVVTITREW